MFKCQQYWINLLSEMADQEMGSFLKFFQNSTEMYNSAWFTAQNFEMPL